MLPTWPDAARWLPPNTPTLNRTIVRRALCDVFILEAPPGSNRGTTIDDYNRRAGVPLGSPYCASSTMAWWSDAGADTPPLDHAWWTQHKLDPNQYGPGSARGWHKWALVTARFSSQPIAGGAVLYGDAAGAHHIGTLIRLEPIVMSFEANTSMDGVYNRDGVGFDRKILDLAHNARILGFISPTPL